MTTTLDLHLAYWTTFAQLLDRGNFPLHRYGSDARHYMRFRSGKKNIHLSAFIKTQVKYRQVGVGLVLDDVNRRDALHEALLSHREEIERAIGAPLNWESPMTPSRMIALIWPGQDPLDPAQWPEQHVWLRDKLLVFHRVFRPFI